MIRKIKKHLPWWSKILIKMVTARIPLNYSIFKKIGLFEHGDMSDPSVCVDKVNKFLQYYEGKKPFTFLELGPGDSVGAAAVGSLLEANSSWLVDVGNYATQDISFYNKLLFTTLKDKGLNTSLCTEVSSREDFLSRFHSHYLTNGLESLKTIPSDSVDFIFSCAVLEHVRRYEFLDVMKELHRITKPNAISIHQVDLRDHLDESLNNLRFSEKLWESDFFVKSGFYTNRIQFKEMCGIFEKSGFKVEVLQKRYFDKLMSKSQMHSMFQKCDEEDLNVSGFLVKLQSIK